MIHMATIINGEWITITMIHTMEISALMICMILTILMMCMAVAIAGISPSTMTK